MPLALEQDSLTTVRGRRWISGKPSSATTPRAGGRSLFGRYVHQQAGGSPAASRRFFDAVAAAGGGERVLEQTRDGHGADAARHGRDPARVLHRLLEADVAHEPGLLARRHPVDADVDHRGARFDPVSPDHPGTADRGDQNIRFPGLGRKVLSS